MMTASRVRVDAGGGVTVMPNVIHIGIKGTLAISLYWVLSKF
jgi:hypothetical protein